MNSRERVMKALRFEPGDRAPRQMWKLPWADVSYPGVGDQLAQRYPDDLAWAPGFPRVPLRTTGDLHRKGIYVDPWGCVFENLQDGIMGEVKEPIVRDWSDTSRVRFPEELLTIDVDKVNDYCRNTDLFLLGGCARPFEQLQFLRGTEELFIDLAEEDPAMLAFLGRMHAFYLRQFEAWAATEVDAFFLIDDWGSQNSLLVHPDLWRKHFKPLYAEYAALAHAAGKRVFMHSDGNILAILPDLIEIGVDAINSQIFCMGLERLAPFAGRITFWGEIDRQHLLVSGTHEEIRQAVREVKRLLGASGGVIAQCEFGPGSTPDRVEAVFEEWEETR